MSAKTIRSHPTQAQRPKTSQTQERKRHYLTSGQNVTPDTIRKMKKEILKPYKPASELKSMDDVRKYWENEQNKKLNERKAHFAKRHNYKSRLNVLWKLERLFVPEEMKLPGGSITDDIDPTFFTILSGRPIKEKKNTREYLQDIRDCFMTRLKTGYYLDEILLMDERLINERKRLEKVKKNFSSCQKGFEEFLKEDHVSSSTLLETAKEESKKSKDKLQVINGLKKELNKIQADVLVVEEKWRNLRMFQKFFYIISPSEWRKGHDPYYGREDVGVIASDPCLFDSFREYLGDTKYDFDDKIRKFQEDVKLNPPPELYFTDPQEVLNILVDLERNNFRALIHCKDLGFPAEKITAEIEKAKTLFEQQEKSLQEEINYLQHLVNTEEKKAQTNESKAKETVFSLFRDMITNEEYLSLSAYVEDAYEDAVGPNDSNLDLVEMIKEIELKHENLLLALDKMPNDVMIRTTKNFYKEQKRELKEAMHAEKKVHQMETLLKRLSKALARPKKGVKERKIVPRSLPPEELMFKYKLPRILSRERKEYLFFFGKTPDNVRLYKPLCL